MNAQKKTRLYTAIATLFTAVAATPAEAVQLSPEGRGQVLLFPYYTARTDGAGNAYSTLVSVVNSTPSVKAVRVRFLEGRNSREVLHFNLFLSPLDVWTAAVLPDMTTGGAKIGTLDRSCTLPAFSASSTAPYVTFVNFAYSGFNDDGAGSGVDRAKEGYFEIIEMATFASTSTTAKAVTHTDGSPLCTMPGGPTPENPFPPFPPTSITDAQAAADAQPPTGGLFGSMVLINVNSGTEYSSDPTALANFNPLVNYQPVGTLLPDLTQASPPMSAIHASNGALYESTWLVGTADAVSALLMHDSLMNEFVLDTATKSATDWVVTMPTKRFYVPTGTGTAARPFQRNFDGMNGSCDDLKLNIFDREERLYDPGVSGSSMQASLTYSLCWTANVISYRGLGGFTITPSVFGSPNGIKQTINSTPPTSSFTNIDTQSIQNGWMTAFFPSPISGASPDVHKLVNTATTISGGGRTATTGNTVTYFGLPVIGFAATSYANGTLSVGSQTVLSNYGGNFTHKTTTLIQ